MIVSEQNRLQVVLLVPDGVGIRNFVLGRFLDDLSATADVHVFHVIPEELLAPYRDRCHPSVRWYPLVPYRQTRTALSLQDSLGYAHMYWANTMSMQRALGRPLKGPLRSQLFVRATRLAARALATPRAMKWLDAALCSVVRRRPETAEYTELFQRIRPDVLFCSHQRPTSVLPAVLAARDLGIPTASFIFSWDNLSSKARIAAPFEQYLVWSDFMAGELKQYYPEISDRQIHVVGTPQFDPYADERLLWSREEFFRKIGADPDRPLICYSGGDAGTCPEDPKHVAALLQLIRDGQIRNNPQVLVRPVPVDDGARYASVRAQYPELLFAQPRWIHTVPGNWARVIPTAEDIQFLVNLTEHCDMNVNLGSTMTLDFGIHDKPVVNTAFDMSDPPVFGMPVWEYYYKYEHFQPVLKFGASRVARSAGELAEFVNAYIQEPSLDREGRRRLVDLQVGVRLGDSGRVIAATLESIARRRTESRGATLVSR